MNHTMQYIRLILAALVLLPGLLMQAVAQLEVRLDAPRKEFVPGENVPLVVTITNHTDGSIALTNTPGRSWLHLSVTRYGELTPVPPENTPRYPDITLTPGSRRAFTITLRPHYALTREGTYRAMVTLRLPDMRTTYSSNSVSFSLSSGGTLRQFTVQARGQRLVTSVKLLSFKGISYIFGQVMNADTRHPIGACLLGQYVNFMEPKVLLDRAQNMHVLIQSTPEFFTYAVMDTYGSRRQYVVLKRTGGPVDLVSTGGGIRYIGLVPYKKPKKDSDTMHSASERP